MVVAGFVVLVAVPLGAGSYQVYRDATTIAGVRPVAEQWAAGASTQIVSVTGTAAAIRIEALGPPPGPDVAPLRRALDGAGYADVPVEVSLVLGGAAEPSRRRMSPPDDSGRQGAAPFRRPRPRSTALRMARTT